MKEKEALKVLLIEDDLSHAELIKRQLEKTGSDVRDVVHAISGKKGLEILRKEVFDLVLLDYSLPGIDGLEVLRNMRRWD